MTKTIKNILLFPFRFALAFIAFIKWYFINYDEALEKGAERRVLEAEAAKAMAPYVDKLKAAKEPIIFGGEERSFSPIYHNISGKEVVLPLFQATNFIEARDNYYKIPSHAHAKTVIKFMTKENLNSLNTTAQELGKFDRAEFERVLDKYYLAFCIPQEEERQLLKVTKQLENLEMLKKEYERKTTTAVLEGAVSHEEDENGLV